MLGDGIDLKNSKDWVRFAKRCLFSPPLLGQLPKAHVWSAATVLTARWLSRNSHIKAVSSSNREQKLGSFCEIRTL
jgi:hypothetical protein